MSNKIKQQQTEADVPLFRRLGGLAAIEATVDAFYESVLSDEELAPFFANADLQAIKKSQICFFETALSGAPTYGGRNGEQPTPT
jgi:hemoglobin